MRQRPCRSLPEQAGYETCRLLPGRCLCDHHLYGDKYGRPEIPADASPRQKMNPDAVGGRRLMWWRQRKRRQRMKPSILLSETTRKRSGKYTENFRKGEKSKTECSCDGGLRRRLHLQKEKPESQEAPAAELASMSEGEFCGQRP